MHRLSVICFFTENEKLSFKQAGGKGGSQPGGGTIMQIPYFSASGLILLKNSIGF